MAAAAKAERKAMKKALKKKSKSQFAKQIYSLPGKAPKVSMKNRTMDQILRKGPMRDYMLKTDPYYRTLRDPFNIHGVKIPDLEVMPSATITCVKQMQVTVNANGVCGVVLGACGADSYAMGGSLVPVNYTWDYNAELATPGDRSRGGVGTTPTVYNGIQGAIGMTLGAVASSTASLFQMSESVNPTVDQSHNYPIRFDKWDYGTADATTPGTAALQTCPVTDLFSAARVVSFGASITFQGNYTNANGRIIAASVARGTIPRGLISADNTADSVSLLPGAQIIPVNHMGGATVLYRPTDSRSLQYADILEGEEHPTYAYTSVDDYFVSRRECSGAQMFLIVTGCTAGAVFQVTIVGNYEVIPRTTAMQIVGASPSPSDPIALSQVMQHIQKEPVVLADTAVQSMTVANPNMLSPATPPPQQQPQMAVHPAAKEQEESWLDKIIGGVGSVAKTVGPLIPVIASML